ncbi:MAG: hypothetical protein JEZ03_08620 [Bacteroidales bacterium]|nr:hypothetical protein [Bacteroidales bacterium]
MKYLGYIILVLILSSCCRSELNDTIRFNQSDLLIIPYTGDETLTFVDDSNNIISYDNGSREIKSRQFDEHKGGFCSDYFMVELFDITNFKSDYKDSDLSVKIQNDFDVDNPSQTSATLKITWNYDGIGTNSTQTYFPSDLTLNTFKEEAIEEGKYQEFITLRSTNFKDIFIFPGNSPHPERLHGDTLYYSIEEGIVGIRFSDGNLWVIQQ